MTYKETINYLYTQLPMFTRIGAAAIKYDLNNINALTALSGQPHQKFPSIHVAGTNGKGTVTHTLSAVLQSLGYKTGVYVSPHYKDFRERIKINGVYITKKYVQDYVQNHLSDFERIKPSFFEITFAMAVDYFANEKIDIAVIEVGLGGRLDSTNIISPLLSIITNISYDHMDMLGDTLAKIAYEKAGIIKQNTPVVIGEEHPETTPVFEAKAKEMSAPIYFAERNIKVNVLEKDLFSLLVGWSVSQLVYENLNKLQINKKISQETKRLTDQPTNRLRINLSGAFQEKNIATVFESIEVMRTLPFFANVTSEQWKNAIELGLGNIKTLTNFIGRWQVLQHKPLIIGDSAHNEAGLKYVMQELGTMKFNRLHIVVGMVRDKDITKMLALFPSGAVYYFCKANIPRGLPAEDLKTKAESFGLHGKTYASVLRAFAAAKKSDKEEDLIYVGGSIFVLAEVL